jgi:PKD repeat protein
MRKSILVPAMAATLASLAFGQMTTVIPNGAATTEGSSSTSYPFNTNNTNGHRIQYCYSAATTQATTPIVISGMKFRTNGSTTGSWTGGTYANATVKLSTAAVPFNAMTTTFASNEGGDVVTVFSGTITVKPTPATGSTNPGVWYVDIQFQNNFLYDPSKGDLLLDVTLPGPRAGGTSYAHDMLINSPNDCYRMYSYSDASSATGSGPYSAGLVIELQYNPANGIYADFKATPVEGKSPLQVQFTDTTFSSDPNGVTKWEWDFNNDQVVDSTVQNPQFTFTGVGYDVKYTVSLKTTDGSNGSSTVTKKDFIVVNPFPVASATSFGAGSTVPAGVPGPMQLPGFSNTYSYTYSRGFYFQAPTTFTINSFNVPNEASKPEQSVWFFTYPGTTPPSSYAVTAADTKFFGTGPTTAALVPTTPIVIQQGTWCGVFGACHDPNSTTMENSYSASATNHPTTILGAPTVLTRLLFQNPARRRERHRLRLDRNVRPDRPRRARHPRQPADDHPDPRCLRRHALLRRQPAARHDRRDPGRAGWPALRLAQQAPGQRRHAFRRPAPGPELPVHLRRSERHRLDPAADPQRQGLRGRPPLLAGRGLRSDQSGLRHDERHRLAHRPAVMPHEPGTHGLA